ncbi:hypothetical protein [Flagellimonas sp. GZD32]|uniref:hypothetical protein n=1 Tax=Flagellimonas cixiensis TaxID=3228750 RepID=UPI0035C894F4
MKISELFKYPLSYLIIILIGYTIFDYFDHINRDGSVFAQHPWYWLMFSFSGVLSFILVVPFIKMAVQKMFNRKNLVIEVAAIGIWLSLYIAVFGPLLDKLLWPFGELHFKLSFGPFIIILLVYFILRILINLVIGKKALYSK